MKQAFYPFYKQNIARALKQESTFVEAFLPVPGCQTCMYKRGIRLILLLKICLKDIKP